MFHVTEESHLESILASGLIPPVYLTSDWDELLQVDVEQRDGNPVLLEVDAQGMGLVRDPEFDDDGDEWVWYTGERVPPERIRVLGRVSMTRIGTGVLTELVPL